MTPSLLKNNCPFLFCNHVTEKERAGFFTFIVFLLSCSCKCHAGIQKVLLESSNFFSDKGKEDPNSTKSGPSSARQRNAIYGFPLSGQLLPDIECWLGSFVIFQGIPTSIAKKPYIFVPPSGSAHKCAMCLPWDAVCWSVVCYCGISLFYANPC